MFTAVILLVLLCTPSRGSPTPRDNFPVYSITLDPMSNLRLDWTVDHHQEHINVQLLAEDLPPQSWLAVGFSDRGDWSSAHLCVAWEDWKGFFHVQDAYTDFDGVIHVDDDDVHDCQKAEFRRHGIQALVEFRRSFRSCSAHGYSIEDGTTHVVYAFGSGPLYRIKGLKPLEKQFGFQRTRLLKPAFATPATSRDVRPLQLTHSQVNVPAQETTYWCRVFRLPQQFRTKHHVLKFEAAIEEGNEALVHHMEVFHCEAEAQAVIDDYNGPCTDIKRPNSTNVCKRVLAAWAYGAGPFTYPQEAGLPIGGQDFNPYVMLEVHYNNPSSRGDWVDSSGIRLWYTHQLRKYDAGVMELGLEYTDKMAIPPKQDSFTLTGYCLPQCTAVGVPRKGITVFGSQLHTHLLGFRVVTQHFRAGEELAELDRDNHYSTHYQEIRLLARPVQVFPGDALMTTCWYNSSVRENVTLGGFSISDEMCVNYIHYFPRINLEVCKSSISTGALHNYFDFMNKWEKQTTERVKGVQANYQSIEWNRLRGVMLERLYATTDVSMQCNQSSGARFAGQWDPLPLPAHYRPPPASSPLTLCP